MRTFAPELPNVTFERDLVLHDKAHDLHLVFRGRGHTAGDVVVWCPQKKVVATGDLLHGFAPYIGDGYPLEWPRTLHSVAECAFEHVIGGHAAVQHTRERLSQMAAYIEELTEAVVVGRRQQKSVERLQQEITPATLKSLSRGYGDFISGSTLKFGMNRPGLTAAEALVAAVKSNTAHIHAALERG
jgi:glyoxylase-like metal-dependent hydrolase (beta-lactamase superfamily II)